MVFWNALAHRICIEDGQVKVLTCHSVIAEDRAVTLCEKCDGSGFVHDADGMEDNCDCGALNARMKADQQRGEDRAVTAPPVPPPADARWFPDPPPGPSRAVTAPQEPSLRALKLDALIELVANLPRYNCDCLPNGPDGKTMATDEEVQNNSDVYSCNRWVVLATDLESAIGVVHTIRDVEKDEAFLKLAALTHAIEALRGKWLERGALMCPVVEASKLPNQGWTSQQFTNRLAGAILLQHADDLAAILKEWEGRHA
jgi:hypothetical protein